MRKELLYIALIYVISVGGFYLIGATRTAEQLAVNIPITIVVVYLLDRYMEKRKNRGG